MGLALQCVGLLCVCVFVCTECPRGRWGVGCQQVCQCHHSSGCDPVSGECLCLPGWFGRTCSQGIYTQHADRLADSFYNHQEHTNKQSELCTKQVIAPGAARRYAPRRWQFDSRRIYVRPRTGPQSAHLWRPAVAKLQAASVPMAYGS